MAHSRYAVVIDVAAEADLNDIADYLIQQGADRAAVRLIETMLDRIDSLATMPLRGAVPKEMEGAAGRGFRQFVSGRYRVIYQVGPATVTVVLIADGRRDMRSLLTERLLGS